MDSTASPRVVGRYLLYDAIAAGGMATVHLGRLVGPVGFSRIVAIKRMHEHLARDPEFAQMFLDEAHVVSRIRHPNVVPTLDVVALDDQLLLVMEYVAGEALSRLLERARATKNPPPIPLVVDILLGVLHGLEAVHELRDETGEPLHIVHRDVSPQNILVGTDGVARVVDFGIARSRRGTHNTRDGYIKGKLQYMAPEQLRGQPATPATDIFATSLVLFEALTGQDPFNRQSEADLVYSVLEGRPTPPSAFRAEIPHVLDDVILQGLNKEPSERFLTAKAMAAALESAVAPVSRSAVSRWVMNCARKEIERRAALVARVERDISPAGGTPEPLSERFRRPKLDSSSGAGPSKSDAPVALDAAATSDTPEISSFEGALRPRIPRRTLAIGAGVLALSVGMVVGFQGVSGPARVASETSVLAPSFASPTEAPPEPARPWIAPTERAEPSAPTERAEPSAPTERAEPSAPTERAEPSALPGPETTARAAVPPIASASPPSASSRTTAPRATPAKARAVKEIQADRIYIRD